LAVISAILNKNNNDLLKVGGDTNILDLK